MEAFKLEKFADVFVPGSRPSRWMSVRSLGMANVMHWWAGSLFASGTLSVNDEVLYFTSNLSNPAIHLEIGDVYIATADFVAVAYEPGMFTGVVRVTHQHGELRFRCLGAKAVAQRLHEAFIAPKAARRPVPVSAGGPGPGSGLTGSALPGRRRD